jgi:hypothetical protein
MQIAPTLFRTAVRSLALACLACNSVAAVPPQDSPRKLIERAAYAEEHERDFDAALELYAKAAKAATDAGDAATAKEASAARERVLARQGKATSQVSKEDESLVNGRAAVIVGEQSKHAQGSAEAIALFGSRVIPWLAQMLTASGAFGIRMEGANASDVVEVIPNPRLAAESLVAVGSPEAWAVLDRSLGSPDPTVRLAIVKALPTYSHLDVARRAALDPVPAVRDAAIALLAKTQDASNIDVMEAAGRNGSWAADDWLAGVAPERVLAIGLDRSAGVEARRTALGVIAQRPRVEAKLETAKQLLAVGTNGDEASLHTSGLSALSRVLWNWKNDPRTEQFRDDAAKLIAAELERDLSSELLFSLGTSTSVSTVKALGAALPRVAASSNELVRGNFVRAIDNAGGPSTPEHFEAWLALYRAVPPDFPHVSGDSDTLLQHVSRQLGQASRLAPLDAIARGASGLVGEAK